MIDAREIDAIAEWIDRRLGEGEGDAVTEWFAVRDIEELAVIRQAARYAVGGMSSLGEGQDLHGVLTSVCVIGFQLGLDAERRRRDRQELPA